MPDVERFGMFVVVSVVVGILREQTLKTEQALREGSRELKASEEKYHSLLEDMQDGYFVLQDEKVVFANRRVAEMFGGDYERMIGKPFANYLPQETLATRVDTYRRRLRGELPPQPYELEIMDREGRPIPAEVHTKLAEYEGRPAIICVIRAITERKRAEEALRESEERYRGLVESALDIIYTVSPDGVVTSLNPAFETITGWSRPEWIGKQFASLLHPEDLPLAMELFQDAIQAQTAGTLEARILAKSGEYLQVEVRSTPQIQNEKVIGFWGVARDVSERKQAEEQLRSSEERLRILFEFAPDAYYLQDFEGNFIDVNRATEELTGYERAEIAGKNVFKLSLLSAEHISKGTAFLARNALGQPTGPDEFVLNRKDGNRVTVEIRTFPVEIKGQALTLGIARDITERKRAEEELKVYSEHMEEMVGERTWEVKDAQEKLVRSEKLAAIGQLASSVAHELRQPLTVLNNSAYYLKIRLGDGDEKVRKHLDILEKEVDIANSIISDLLDFARARQTDFKEVDVNAVVRETLARTTVPDNIILVPHLEEPCPPVWADPLQLQEVFTNLISNAVQAMKEGGRLKIATGEHNRFAQVEFTDTGVGIPRENLDRIFEPLVSTTAGGVGLGLAVTKSIVEAHQGSIDVRSEPGKGATFVIRLPLAGREVSPHDGES